MHAEFKFDDSIIVAGQIDDESKMTPCQLYDYVENCDEAYKVAMSAGAESVLEPVDQFYGDRNAAVRDKWGNQWWFATHLKEMSNDEIKESMKQN
jgi:PhnB protein